MFKIEVSFNATYKVLTIICIQLFSHVTFSPTRSIYFTLGPLFVHILPWITSLQSFFPDILHSSSLSFPPVCIMFLFIYRISLSISCLSQRNSLVSYFNDGNETCCDASCSHMSDLAAVLYFVCMERTINIKLSIVCTVYVDTWACTCICSLVFCITDVHSWYVDFRKRIKDIWGNW